MGSSSLDEGGQGNYKIQRLLEPLALESTEAFGGRRRHLDYNIQDGPGEASSISTKSSPEEEDDRNYKIQRVRVSWCVWASRS